MVHILKKERAIWLRKNGYSLNEIVRELKIAKSTASLWVSNISLDQKGLDRIRQRITQGRLNSATTRKLQKSERDALVTNLAKHDISNQKITPLLARLMCAMLYWGEGNKTGSSVKFTNSDPYLVATFLDFFRKGFPVKEEKFSVTLHLHPYHKQDELVPFWSLVTGIPQNKFHIYNKVAYGNLVRPDYKGCVCLNYYDVNHFLWLIKLCKGFADILPIPTRLNSI